MCKAVRKQELGKQLAPFCRKEKQYNTVKMRKQATDSIGTFTGQKAKHYFFLFFFFLFTRKAKTYYMLAVKQSQHCGSWKHRTAEHSFPVGSTSSESKVNLKRQRFCLLSDKPEWAGWAESLWEVEQCRISP